METLESSRICRLCGKHCGISINIFDKNKNHVKKINAVLPIIVHEMDLLPKHMCGRCRYKLEEFHEFYIDCLKTDANLKSQLSWMRKETTNQLKGVPMVQIENIKIKSEPLDHSLYDFEPIVFDLDPLAFPSTKVKGANGAFHCEKISSYTTYADFRHYYCDAKRRNQTIDSTDSTNRIERHRNSRKLPYSQPPREMQTSKDKPIDPRNIVRKLRPRRCSINYGSKRKGTFSGRSRSGGSPSSHKRSKSVEIDENAGKTGPDSCHWNGPNLRPRREIVNYLGEKKKRRKGQIEDGSGSMDGGNGHQDEKSSPMGDVTVRVKNKMFVILEKKVSSVDDDAAKGAKCPNAVRNLSKNFDDLTGKNVLMKLEENKKESIHGKTAKDRLEFGDNNHLRSHSKNIPYSPKYLRSHLRNGKVVKFESQDVALRRIRKNLKNIGKRNEVKVNIGKKLMNNLKENVAAKPMAIKRHCEKCGISFANKELFTLHPCYCD